MRALILLVWFSIWAIYHQGLQAKVPHYEGYTSKHRHLKCVSILHLTPRSSLVVNATFKGASEPPLLGRGNFGCSSTKK